jgi:hypothetical protein
MWTCIVCGTTHDAMRGDMNDQPRTSGSAAVVDLMTVYG